LGGGEMGADSIRACEVQCVRACVTSCSWQLPRSCYPRQCRVDLPIRIPIAIVILGNLLHLHGAPSKDHDPNLPRPCRGVLCGAVNDFRVRHAGSGCHESPHHGEPATEEEGRRDFLPPRSCSSLFDPRTRRPVTRPSQELSRRRVKCPSLAHSCRLPIPWPLDTPGSPRKKDGPAWIFWFFW